MKLIIGIFLGSFLIVQSSFAQSDKEQIEETFDQYFNALIQKNNSKVLTYILPGFFEHFTKENMLEAMGEMDEDSTVELRLESPNVTSIAKTVINKDEKYSFVNYTFKMIMIMTPDSSLESDGFSGNEFMLDLFELQYGAKNVSLDKKNRTFEIKVSGAMYAIHSPNFDGWKFLEKKKGMEQIIEQLIPKQIVKAFKNK